MFFFIGWRCGIFRTAFLILLKLLNLRHVPTIPDTFIQKYTKVSQNARKCPKIKNLGFTECYINFCYTICTIYNKANNFNNVNNVKIYLIDFQQLAFSH